MDLNNIFNKLDSWVSKVGNGQYTPGDLTMPLPNLQVLPIWGIQQVREELYALCQILLKQPGYSSQSTALEIGLGHHGSTHFLWRHLFKKIVTIEKNHDRVNQFSLNTEKFYGQWTLGDCKSGFVIGLSHDPVSVEKVYSLYDEIDFLFIDGDHAYKSVLTDWLLYAPLVRSGGMVVFHDSILAQENGGVGHLTQDLRSGRFGKKYKLIDILHSKSVGTSFYVAD